MEQIESAINSNNIFEDENESALQNHIRKISYIVSNYSQEVITINLEKNSSGGIIEEGSAYLAASIYRGEKYILAEIKESKKSIETLFGEIESIQRYEKSKKEEIIKWDTLPAVDNWSNMKYITPLVLKGLEKKNLNQILSSIEPSVWKDIDKLKTIISSLKGVVKFLPQSVLESKELIEAVKDDYVAFGSLWNFHYKNNYTQNNPLAKEIKEKIFSNPDMCLSLLSYSYKIGFLYEFFNDNVKIHPNIIDKLFKDTIDEKIIDILPTKFFEKEENVVKFLKKVPYFYLDGKEYIYERWINDKDKLISFFNDKEINCMSSFYEYIPKKIKNDKEFILACIPRFKDVIEDISYEQLKDLDILKAIISNNATKKIPSDILYSLKDKETIEMAVKDSYSILLDANTPKQWLLNDDIISCVPSQHLKEFPHDIFNKYLSLEKNCLVAIDSYPEIYKDLPNRSNPVLGIYLLCKIEEKKSLLPLLDIIPKSLWSNKELCLIAMSSNIHAVPFVPPPFFNHKDFLSNFFKDIDSKRTNVKAINYVPIHIQDILEQNNVTSNYESFLNSYLLQQNLNDNLNDKPSKRKIKL